MPIHSVPDDIPQWLFGTVMPFWAQNGMLHDAGCFAEQLDPATRLPDTNPSRTRLRVQARQIYAFSHAFVMTRDHQWLETARRGYEFMINHGWVAEPGGWAHLVAPDGTIMDDRMDCYDHAFYLLALAWYYRASGDPDVPGWIDRTVAALDRNLTHPAGGYYEQALQQDGTYHQPGTLPRRQNPHMHLLESWLALYEATQDQDYLVRAGQIMDLFRRYFYRPDTRSLAEFFRDDWSLAAAPAGLEREPGHYFEWVWLIHQYARLSGDRRDVPAARSLYEQGLTCGIDYRPGRLFAAIDGVDPLGNQYNKSRRMWPQTELLKAALCIYEHEGNQTGLMIAHGVLRMMFSSYLQLDGSWIDLFDENGHAVPAPIPASTLYHLFVAIAEWCRVCRS